MFPGGKVELEESMIQACKREIKEELGLNIEVEFKLCEVKFGESTQHYFIYHVLSSYYNRIEYQA